MRTKGKGHRLDRLWHNFNACFDKLYNTNIDTLEQEKAMQELYKIGKKAKDFMPYTSYEEHDKANLLNQVDNLVRNIHEYYEDEGASIVPPSIYIKLFNEFAYQY